MEDEGLIQVTVRLPQGQTKQLKVNPSMPLMNLMGLLTCTNHLPPTDFVIQPLTNHSSRRCISQPPLTNNIGSLGTTTFNLAPKISQLSQYRQIQRDNQKQTKMPEIKPRVKVFMPEGQLHVLRVSRDATIWQIQQQLCSEKSLNFSDYRLVHPVNRDEVLSVRRCLSDYQIQDVALVKNEPSQSQIDRLLKPREGSRSPPSGCGRDDSVSPSETNCGSCSGGSHLSVSSGSSGEKVRVFRPKSYRKRQAPPPPSSDNATQLNQEVDVMNSRCNSPNQSNHFSTSNGESDSRPPAAVIDKREKRHTIAAGEVRQQCSRESWTGKQRIKKRAPPPPTKQV